VNLSVDPTNCGVCGSICDGEECAGGSCGEGTGGGGTGGGIDGGGTGGGGGDGGTGGGGSSGDATAGGGGDGGDAGDEVSGGDGSAGDGSGGDGSAGGDSGPSDSGSGGPTLPPGGIGGTVWGDPHFVTFDGFHHDFQGAGEFILFTDGEGFTVQTRQVPLGDPATAKVCTTRAVAAQVGSDVVALYLGAATPLYINHVPTTLSGSMYLPGGGAIQVTPGKTLIVWPSGDLLDVRTTPHAFNVYPGIRPISRALSGLLGNADGNAINDIATRSGTVLVNPTFATLYPAYADSWRIGPSESLFDYAAGESTASFTIEAFPPVPQSSSSLTPSAYAAAYATCRAAGVTEPSLLDACILDFALTGDQALVAAAAVAKTPTASLSFAGYTNDFEGAVNGTAIAGISPQINGAGATPVALTPGSAAIPATHYLGPLTNQIVTAELIGLPVHTSVTAAFDLYVIGPWTGGSGAQATFSVGFSGGWQLGTTTFSNTAATQAFPYLTGNGLTAARSASIAVDQLGFGTDTVYHLQYTFDHDSSSVALQLTVAGLPTDGTQSWGVDNMQMFFNRVPGATSTNDGYEQFHGPAGAPATVGCADGTREGFLDPALYPTVAGCAATWTGNLSMRATATGAACGDGIGSCAAPADACASGWHVCGASGSVAELRALTADACSTGGKGAFYAALSGAASQASGCPYDLTPTANYACYDSGLGSSPVCCGTSCGALGGCTGGVWPGWTHTGTGVCADFGGTGAGHGVLCCQ
jgi:hypothetical protein